MLKLPRPSSEEFAEMETTCHDSVRDVFKHYLTGYDVLASDGIKEARKPKSFYSTEWTKVCYYYPSFEYWIEKVLHIPLEEYEALEEQI